MFQDVPRGAQATRQRGYSAPVSGRGRRSWRLATGYRAGPWLWSYETRSWGFPPGAHSYVAGPGLHGEAVGEVGIYGPRFGDPKGIHDDEAQAVGEAVLLVLVPGQVLEGRFLFRGARAMDARHLPGVEVAADLHREVVAGSDG